MVCLFAIVSSVVQSRYFGSLASTQVNKYLEEKFNTRVEFTRINISLFPMSTTLEGVKAFKKNLASFNFKEIQVSISPLDILKSKLKVSELKIHDGYLELYESATKQKDENVDFKKFKEINRLIEISLKELPLNIGVIVLDDIDIIKNEQKISLIHSNIELGGDYQFNLKLNNFKFNNIYLDQVSLNGNIKENKINILRADVLKNRTKISSNGKIYIEDNWVYDFSVNYSGEIAEFIPEKEVLKYRLSGMCECDIKISGFGDSYRASASGLIRSLMSNFFESNEIKLSADLENEILKVKSLVSINDKTKLEIRNPVTVNLEKKKIEIIDLNVEKLNIGKLVNGLSGSKVLEGEVSGSLSIELADNLSDFDAKGKVKLTGVKIGENSKIIELNDLDLSDLKVEKKKVLSVSSNGYLGISKIFIAGNIFDKSLDIKLKIDDFELSELGGAIGRIVAGKGQMDASFKGDFSNVELKLFANNVKELKVLDYNLYYNSNVEMSYQFKENIIEIAKISSDNILEIQNGFVDLSSDSLDLLIRFKDMQFINLKRHLHPIKEKLEFLFEKISGEISGRARLTGNFSNINVKADVMSKKFAIMSEPLSLMKLDFKLDTKKIVINEMFFARGDGNLSLQGEYNYQNGIKSLRSNAQGIRLTDFLLYRNLGLGYDTEVNYQFKIDKTDKGLVGAGVTRFLSSNVGRKRIKPSSISFDILNDELVLKGSLLGTRLAFDSKLYLGNKKAKKSNINATISIEDIRLLLGMISLHNVYDSDLAGFVSGNIQSTFSLDNMQAFDLSAKVEKFFLRKNDKEVSLSTGSQNLISINDSDIEALDIGVNGSGGEYILRGLGNLKERAKIEQLFSIDLSFLQLLSNKIIRSSGKLSGSGIFFGSIEKFDDSHSLKAENVMIIHKDFPLIVSDLNMMSILTSKKWEISSIAGKLGSGKVSGKGKIDFIRPVPKINFGLKLDNISYPIAENSRILFDAYLDLVGNSFPYQLRGNVGVNGGNINDEFTAFTGSTGVKKSVDKYIKVKEQGLPEIISLNIDVKTNEKVIVKNRMADLILSAGAKISESPLNPDIKAKVSLVPLISKFKFKGTEFIVSEGTVSYDSTNTLNTLFLNLTANARISTYDIKMEVVGSDDDLKLNMESNPTLSKEDIFSLLALGVTSDFAKNLEDKDRTSLTTIGLGTLIVDQLKINEGLDSTLGLKLSVLPEVGDNESTPIQNSKNEAISKNKTATKLRIQKKVTNNVGLTFANTFGSSEGQKQEMNIDFNINKKWSIQGVFESDTASETGDGNSNSLGADIKYRWDF